MQPGKLTIPVQKWVDFLVSDYLDSFIKEGGATIKFAVCAEGQFSTLEDALTAQCRKLNYLFLKVNAVDTRVYLPQEIFFAISKQVDWRRLARRMTVKLAEAKGYDVSGVDSTRPGNIYEIIGEANGLEASSVVQEVRVEIQNKVARHRNMSRDFRVAMSHLGLMEGSNTEEYSGQLLLDWLTGANNRIGNVRHFQIRTPITRMTARHYLESALYWIRYSGYTGAVVFLDNARVTLARRPDDRSRFYTKAMVAEHYELLREFIDSADRMSNTLVVVASNTDFLNEDSSSRGFGSYQALMTRVMDDVRDKNQVNPMASLVRLA